ncbi:MAG: Crp/Fnr family transcriptional regulator [Treponema sp.]|jgi:CRP-like cAMP-binding protein|nr:Crp/Fnr family transcriptional regulator [Treponema sp.]
MASGLDMESFSRFARTFQAGELIFAEFEPGDTFYLIQTGRVQLVKIIGDTEKTLDILQPGDMFGEMAILENSPRSATAITLDKVTVLEFNRRNFEILMLGNPQITLRLLKIFAKRIYDFRRRFMILTLKEPHVKIADVFLMLDETEPGIDRHSEQRMFKTTIEDVARWAGVDIQQTRDILSQFANQHRIEFYPDIIVVKNINDFNRLVRARRK